MIFNYNKEKICIEIDNMEMYENIYTKIIKHSELYVRGGPGDMEHQRYSNTDWRNKDGCYKFIENHSYKDLVKELGELCRYVKFKDYDTGEIILYIDKATVNFDKVDFIKPGTFNKFNKGYCK